MAAAKTRTAGERLAELEEHVAEARRRRAQVDADRRAALRAVRAAEDARFELEERRGAGEAVADEEVTDAVGGIDRARAEADERLWSARREGAGRALAEAEEAVLDFGREHFAELAAEIAADDGPARDALVDAWEGLQGAAGAYARQTRRWHHLARFGGLPVGAIPSGTPLRGDVTEVAQRFEAGIPVPTPPALAEG